MHFAAGHLQAGWPDWAAAALLVLWMLLQLQILGQGTNILVPGSATVCPCLHCSSSSRLPSCGFSGSKNSTAVPGHPLMVAADQA
jgi:hypothetical protein